MAATASREAEWSDIDPNGNAFDYSRRDWARLVYSFGDAGTLVHSRYETYGRELEAGRHIALPAPARRAAPSRQVAAATPQLASAEKPVKLSEPPVDYVQDAEDER